MLKRILNERANDQGNGKRFNTEDTEGGIEGTERDAEHSQKWLCHWESGVGAGGHGYA
jgi:hypothetical protein